jgi:hypothetical protein
MPCRREAAVDGGLGDGVGVEDSLPLVHGLPRAHQEVAVRQPWRTEARAQGRARGSAPRPGAGEVTAPRGG